VGVTALLDLAHWWRQFHGAQLGDIACAPPPGDPVSPPPSPPAVSICALDEVWHTIPQESRRHVIQDLRRILAQWLLIPIAEGDDHEHR